MKNAGLKLQSLSDLNEQGHAILTLIRHDNEGYAVTLTDSDLAFWESRIAAVRSKAKESKPK